MSCSRPASDFARFDLSVVLARAGEYRAALSDLPVSVLAAHEEAWEALRPDPAAVRWHRLVCRTIEMRVRASARARRARRLANRRGGPLRG